MAALGGDVDIGLHAPLLEESSSALLAAASGAGSASPNASSGSSFDRSLSVGSRPRYSCRSRSSVDTPATVAEASEPPPPDEQQATTPAPMHITSPGGSGPRSSGPHSAPSKFEPQMSKSRSLVHADV